MTERLAAALAGTPARLGRAEALRLVCTATGWPVGHAWVRLEGSWRSAHDWYAVDDAAYAKLIEVTEACDLGPGRGVVAAVLHLEATRFLSDLRGLGSEARRDVAQAAGLRAAVGVPVVADGAVVAVLEFLTTSPVEPVDDLADLLREAARRAMPAPAVRDLLPASWPFVAGGVAGKLGA